MLDYIMKLKTLADNLSAIGESVSEKDHILQILGGLGADYNSIVASPTGQKEEIFLLYKASCSLMSSIWNLRIRLLKILYFLLILLSCASLIRINIFVEICIIRLIESITFLEESQMEGDMLLSNVVGVNFVGNLDTGIRCYHRFDIHYQGSTSAQESSSFNKSQNSNSAYCNLCVIFKLKCNLIFNK